MPDTHHWYRGNLHIHSFRSDGRDFPDVIAEGAKARGCHA